MNKDWTTPDEVRQIAIALSDAVTNDAIDDVLWESQELGKALNGLFDYQRHIHTAAAEHVSQCGTPRDKAEVICNAVLDAIDVGDYGEAELWLNAFTREYNYALQLDALAERNRA